MTFDLKAMVSVFLEIVYLIGINYLLDATLGLVGVYLGDVGGHLRESLVNLLPVQLWYSAVIGFCENLVINYFLKFNAQQYLDFELAPVGLTIFMAHLDVL